MKKVAIVFLMISLIGCAKVQVETVKPIKVDINMRVDVYQHVVDDVESLNDQIYGGDAGSFNFIFGIKEAYASDTTDALDQAIRRRRNRVDELQVYFEQGSIGVNRNALIEIIDETSFRLKDLVSQENQDREIMQREVAKKNKADIQGVRRVFFEDEYKRAGPGVYFEVYDIEKDRYIWQKK